MKRVIKETLIDLLREVEQTQEQLRRIKRTLNSVLIDPERLSDKERIKGDVKAYIAKELTDSEWSDYYMNIRYEILGYFYDYCEENGVPSDMEEEICEELDKEGFLDRGVDG